jgi:glycosyltransferase involved in cell wall biosynthesis
MDVYRFFSKPPEILLVRRGTMPADHRLSSGLSVALEVVPLPVKGLEDLGFVARFLAVFFAIIYLLYAMVVYLRVRIYVGAIQVVHAHYIFPQGLFGLFLSRLLGVPLIVTVTGHDVNRMMSGGIALRAACLWVLRRAYTTIAVSRPIQSRLSTFGLRNSVYIPNSVDTSVVPIEHCHNQYTLMFVGKLTNNKRPLVLVEAFGEVVRRVPEALLLMIGDGPLRESVRKEIIEMGLEERVMLFQNVSPQRVDHLRSQAAIFVLPSASEGLSLALLEAMARGQIIIASRNESHASFLTSENGLLFEVDSVQDLARQILLAISDDDLRLRLSSSARHTCETEFSNAVVSPKLESVYREAVQVRARKRAIRE